MVVRIGRTARGAEEATAGGIFLFYGTCTVKDVTIQNNKALAGAGMWLQGRIGGSAKLTVEGRGIARKSIFILLFEKPIT